MNVNEFEKLAGEKIEPEYNDQILWDAAEITNNIIKEAGLGAPLRGKVMEAVIGGLALGAGIKVVDIGIGAIRSIPENIKINEIRNSLKSDKSIAGADKAKAVQYFDVLRTYAPHMARNELVAKSFVHQLLQYPGNAIDYKLVKDLTESSEKAQRAFGGGDPISAPALTAGQAALTGALKAD